MHVVGDVLSAERAVDADPLHLRRKYDFCLPELAGHDDDVPDPPFTLTDATLIIQEADVPGPHGDGGLVGSPIAHLRFLFFRIRSRLPDFQASVIADIDGAIKVKNLYSHQALGGVVRGFIEHLGL